MLIDVLVDGFDSMTIIAVESSLSLLQRLLFNVGVDVLIFEHFSNDESDDDGVEFL